MDLANGVRAAAPKAPDAAIRALDAVAERLAEHGAFDTTFRIAHLIGQCAHESVQFSRTEESLFYKTPRRLCQVWPSRFRTEAAAAPFCRNPQGLANNVYANRMGNGSPRSGDGFRYRGRGYLQLTGRSNYRNFGRLIGIDLEAEPERAEEPETAWLIAASYFATRKRGGRTAFQWADANDIRTVTRIVNGGTHGLADRRTRTRRALKGLGDGAFRPRPKPTPAKPVRPKPVLPPPVQPTPVQPRPVAPRPVPKPVGPIDAVARRPLLRRGSRGRWVRTLQIALTRSGHPAGVVDGIFGPKTEAALKAFQRSARLRVDGLCGPNSWGALDALVA